jgi:hypothetical protein
MVPVPRFPRGSSEGVGIWKWQHRAWCHKRAMFICWDCLDVDSESRTRRASAVIWATFQRFQRTRQSRPAVSDFISQARPL